jgi:hypothetical protein
MRHRSLCELRCSYVVILESFSGDLRELAAYLTEIAVANFEVIVVDRSGAEDHRRVLRWVGRYVHTHAETIRAAIDLTSSDKVIVADASVRYSMDNLDIMCALLELHEVVEPQDYFDPLPWWGGIDAGRVLVQRSMHALPDRGATFGFRKRIIRGLRSLEPVEANSVRRLASQGAEVFTAIGTFVRRLPPAFSEWVRDLPRRAEEELVVPARAALFILLLPALVILSILGGARMAGTFAGAIAFATFVLAVRGRFGAGSFFPLHTCLLAPLSILQRSIGVYCALFRRVSPRRELLPDHHRDAVGQIHVGRL